MQRFKSPGEAHRFLRRGSPGPYGKAGSPDLLFGVRVALEVKPPGGVAVVAGV